MKFSKLYFLLLAIGILFSSCADDDWPPDIDPGDLNHRQEMKTLVKEISQYVNFYHPDFLVIPQNGENLITDDGEVNGNLSSQFLNAVDGFAREDLFYGYSGDDIPTHVDDRGEMIPWLDMAKADGKKIIVADYCATTTYVDNSYFQNSNKGYISFAAPSRDLDVIPSYPATPYQVNSADIANLDDAKNYLYILDPGQFASKADYLNSLSATNYDMLVIDLYFDEQMLTQTDLTQLKTKANGGDRLVIGYMSIGEIEDYRYYWDADWDMSMPAWILAENPDWAGNYFVQYWNPAWKDILYGNDNSYVRKIMDSGFDGVWLDTVDSWELFYTGS